MVGVPLSDKVALGTLIATLVVSILLLVAEVVRSDDLDGKRKLAWVLALVVGSFFTAVIYFAQGRTGRLGRAASVLMVVGILLAIGIIVVLVLRL